MVTDRELIHRIALTLIPGIGDVLGKKLVTFCGSVEAVFREKEEHLMKIPGIGKTLAQSIRTNKIIERAEKEVRFVQKYKIEPIFYLDDNFPERLKQCEDHPLMLYYKGTTPLEHTRPIAFVGTRRATEYGRTYCKKIIDEIAPFDPLIVSGLAFGIDTIAHRSALEAGLPTIGVLGHGLDKIYPIQNKKLAEMMLHQGGLLTEFMSETNPDAVNFPKRNRIIAGLSDAVVVIEAGKKGGALITADIANSYNRDVFALPGRVNDLYSEGCHFLIKTNRAALVENGADLVFALDWQPKKETTPHQTQLFVDLNPEEEKIVAILREKGDADIDNLIANTQLSSGVVASALLNLEFKDVIKLLPGKVYRLINY